MTKAVFVLNRGSIYDDLPESYYHFPKQYLTRVQATVGDMVVYYQPRRNRGQMVFFAVARVTDVSPDPDRPGFFYAYVADYLGFSHPVRMDESGTSIGRNAVQHVTEDEYQRIFDMGFAPILKEERLAGIKSDLNKGYRLSEEQADFGRPIIERVTRRPFRDAAFADAVKEAYDKTCAMTGLKIINGGGRAEVQAAHIRSVEDKGPDSVRNGIALCGTVHWMFDRGLISISDDYQILTARNKIPEPIERLLRPDRKLILPKNEDFYPHANFLRYHREHEFKG